METSPHQEQRGQIMIPKTRTGGMRFQRGALGKQRPPRDLETKRGAKTQLPKIKRALVTMMLAAGVITLATLMTLTLRFWLRLPERILPVVESLFRG